MEQDNKSKFMPDEEELERQRKEILFEMNKSSDELRKDKNKKLLLITSIIIVLIIFIKVVFGTIEINNIFGYPPSKARFYKLTINDKSITVDYNLKHQIPIVPFLINFNSRYIGSSKVQGDENGTFFNEDGSNKYIVDISSYSCYSGKQQVECTKDSQDMRRNEDTKYKKLIITRTNNPYEVVYSGKFTDDITPYVEKKGVYCVQIIAQYSLIETEVYFYFKK